MSDAAEKYSYPAEVRLKPLSPRVKLAARLYASGACKTKMEAAKAAGLAASTFYVLRQESQVNDLIRKIDKEIEEGVVDFSKVIALLGRRAVRNIAEIAESSEVKDDIRLKANQDLADRSPETSKTLRVQSDAPLTLTPETAQFLSATMLEAARLRDKYATAETGDFVTVSDEATMRSLDLVKENAPKPLPSGEIPPAPAFDD